MINSDLMDLDIELAYKEKPIENLIETSEPKILTSKQIIKAMALLDEELLFLPKMILTKKEGSKFARSLTDCVSCYKEIYLLQKGKQINKLWKNICSH